ncbi:hypothetical protein BRADI_2g02669v3 [Brachypodium distachyon]|uniref:No apical meristem-associated C-terminal domain-containing protein n=1 Tax=Brachypodium distachyon TaxID=15368 RepID=A0A0Q3I9V6_BRADI|nr:hypothetical protein BRADI_2g02669v3 [Brachypodium distachyon]
MDAADVTRRNVENASRHEREAWAKERNADLARQMEAQRAAASAGIPMPRPPSTQHWSGSGSQGSFSSSPSPVSPHMPHDHQGNATPSLSRFFLPDYPDTDPLGGFNPHTFASPPLRRGPLSYGGESIMADMINDGSQHAHYTYTQKEEEPYTAEDTEEREEWADGIEEPVVAAPKGKKKGAAKKKSGGGAWKVVSLDPFTGANQSDNTYCQRVKTAYDERRVINREFASVTHDRNESGLSHRWQMIQQACNKWHGIQEEVRRRPASGSSAHDQMVAMFTAFRDDNDGAEFKFIHVFARIETCDK